MFSHYGFGGPEWGISASEYLKGMSMVPRTEREKEIEQLALELKRNPKLRTWCALLIQGSLKQLENGVWESTLIGKKKPTSQTTEDAQASQKQHEETIKKRVRLIQTIMGKSVHAFIPFWEERVAEELLKLTEDGVFSQIAIEQTFESDQKLANFFQAALVRNLAQTEQLK